jgi:hypothetical protein
MISRIACVFLLSLAVLTAAQAGPVTRREVLAAIAVLEKDVTSTEAVDAATVVARFGKESDAVLITVGAETLPWVQTDMPEAETKVRALLMAAYFAGDIKSQLEKRRPADDPYRGWLAAIKAYRQILKKQPDMVIQEMEDLIAKEQAGTLKATAEKLLKEQDEEENGSHPTNMVWRGAASDQNRGLMRCRGWRLIKAGASASLWRPLRVRGDPQTGTMARSNILEWR